jgi:hypothetical protein
LCLSRPDLDDPHVLPEGLRQAGWVQRVLARDVVDGRVASGLVFAAGPAGMLDEVRALGASERTHTGEPTLEVITNV